MTELLTELEQLRSHIRREQVRLWEDLADTIDQDRRRASQPRFSIASEAVALRVIWSARLVGPTPPETVPWMLVSGRVYHTLLREAGIEVPDVDLSSPEWVDYLDGVASARDALARWSRELVPVCEAIKHTNIRTGWCLGTDEEDCD